MGYFAFFPDDGDPLIPYLRDSQVIINWAKGSTALSPLDLLHWCRETKKLILSFQDLSFTHIYREHNRTADRLSKTVLSYPRGKGSFMEYFENHLVSHDTFQLFWAWLGDYYFPLLYVMI